MTILISWFDNKITRTIIQTRFELRYYIIPVVGLAVGEVGFRDSVRVGCELGSKHVDSYKFNIGKHN